MRRAHLIISTLLCAGGFIAGVYWGGRPVGEPITAARTAAREPDVLRFAAGAPQLAMLQILPAPAMPVPLAEPLNARIVFDESATARISSPVPGRIISLAAQPGDAVKAGEALALIDAPDLGAAQADLAKAKADERRKTLAFQRATELFKGEVLPRKDLEASEADLAQAHAEFERTALRVANLNPRNARLSGQRMLLASPVSGVVAERKANPGMEVRPDLPDPLFVVTDLKRVQVVVDVPEAHLVKIGIGHAIGVQVDAYPDERFAGRVERIVPGVDPATRRVQVRCSVENREARLRPEMYARVTLLADEHRTAVRVPNAALITQGVQHFVFVEREAGVLARRRVELAVQDREFSYLSSGLAQNERVVTSGALLLASELASGQ
ncbi:MAG: efflux RND transporter periplasmic adaptor subunit [Betaproteobacteria bacterium]|nr:efflux RND transporter periplasmic adaptor subunit [Betaproteobacteria bacterium]